MQAAEARELLESLTKNPSLLRHMRTVQLVMEAYARKLGYDENLWSVTGLLHDADYEAFPDEHPNVIVKKLRELGEEEMAYAISAHYTKWNIPCKSALDKVLLATDELTGFVVACAQVRPDGIQSLETKSVVKKLKDKGFAAKVDREEVYKGAELAGFDLNEHITFIIEVLKANRTELGI
jgi:putative nucleotidyltransferase with HDIG domain